MPPGRVPADARQAARRARRRARPPRTRGPVWRTQRRAVRAVNDPAGGDDADRAVAACPTTAARGGRERPPGEAPRRGQDEPAVEQQPPVERAGAAEPAQAMVTQRQQDERPPDGVEAADGQVRGSRGRRRRRPRRAASRRAGCSDHSGPAPKRTVAAEPDRRAPEARRRAGGRGRPRRRCGCRRASRSPPRHPRGRRPAGDVAQHLVERPGPAPGHDGDAAQPEAVTSASRDSSRMRQASAS